MSASQPVVISARASVRDGKFRPTAAPGRDGGDLGRACSDMHRLDAIPPAVAALLAVTSIPLPKLSPTRRCRQNGGERRGQPPSRTSILDEKVPGDVRRLQLSPARAPLDILLSPTAGIDLQAALRVAVNEARSTLPLSPSGSSLRSVSLDSVPSLDMDVTSQLSAGSPLSPASAPNLPRRTPPASKNRAVSSPSVEDCRSDHPLQRRASLDLEDQTINSPGRSTQLGPATEESSTSSRPTSSSGLKSNLTASLRVLRSAARSFGNLTASSSAISIIQAEDFLTRSILSISPQFTDERRPPPSGPGDDVPTAAQRRYYNPPGPASTLTFEDRYLSGCPGPRHLHITTLRDSDPCSAAIQLQTYKVSRNYDLPSPSSPASRTSSSPFRSTAEGTASDRPLRFPRWSWMQEAASARVNTAPVVRSREPRENGDFLRVIVLEMNMRRAGKLSDTAPGKARFVLPPRRQGRMASLDGSSTGRGAGPPPPTVIRNGGDGARASTTGREAPGLQDPANERKAPNGDRPRYVARRWAGTGLC